MKTKIGYLIVLGLVACSPGASDPKTSSTTQLECTGTGEGGNGCCPGSPILVDLAGDGLHLTGPENGVLFFLRPYRLGLWAWTEPQSDDAFLVLDRNENRRIDDGSELFGDGSQQVSNGNPNGFSALAWFDRLEEGGNGDGVIDNRDAVWSKLQLWRDSDHDGRSVPQELISVQMMGIHAFSLNAVPSEHEDMNGNEFRFSAPIVADAPISRVVSDVWLQQAPIPNSLDADKIPDPSLNDLVQYTCWAWVYAAQNWDGSPCNTRAVQTDPVVFANNQFTRLVSRTRTGTIQSQVEAGARAAVFNAILAGDLANPEACFVRAYPNPDSYPVPPYSPPPAGTYHTQCVAQPGDGGSC